MIIWVRRSDYAYSPEPPTLEEQNSLRLYKQVDIGNQPLKDYIEQHGVDGADNPVLPDEKAEDTQKAIGQQTERSDAGPDGLPLSRRSRHGTKEEIED